MYLIFKTGEYFFAVSTAIITRIIDYQTDIIKEGKIVCENKEHNLFLPICL